MLRARLYVITATVWANRILAPTLPDKPLFSSCIVGKHLEYLFESYALTKVLTRPVHGIDLFGSTKNVVDRIFYKDSSFASHSLHLALPKVRKCHGHRNYLVKRPTDSAQRNPGRHGAQPR